MQLHLHFFHPFFFLNNKKKKNLFFLLKKKMSSLAMFAAEYDNDNPSSSLQTRSMSSNKKKQAKTQRRFPNFSEKVNTVLESMHSLHEDDENTLSNYEPLVPPKSGKVSQEYKSELLTQSSDPDVLLDKHSIANTTYTSSPAYPTEISSSGNSLMDKLNYLIHLAEQAQDDRTTNVFEEVILYSFARVQK